METLTKTNTAQLKRDLKLAISVILALGDAIREAGPHGINSGLLYSAVMGKVDAAGFDKAVGYLKGAGVVAESNFQLRWVGPAKQEVVP